MDDGSGLKFANPKLSRPASMAAGARNLEEARKKRKMGKEVLIEDRDNLEMEDIISDDPTEFMRKRLTKLMVREVAINDQLYSMSPPDHRAITDSNKRLMDIGDSLKALPKQSAGANTGSSLSIAEAIAQALEAVTNNINNQKVAATYSGMLERAESNFGDEA